MGQQSALFYCVMQQLMPDGMVCHLVAVVVVQHRSEASIVHGQSLIHHPCIPACSNSLSQLDLICSSNSNDMLQSVASSSSMSFSKLLTATEHSCSNRSLHLVFLSAYLPLPFPSRNKVRWSTSCQCQIGKHWQGVVHVLCLDARMSCCCSCNSVSHVQTAACFMT